jgi:carbon monoxide dehydrogenase subunit G
LATVEHTVEIDAPPSAVFAALVDPEVVCRWQESLVELRRESDGEVGVGTRMKEVRTFVGKRVESQLEVTACEPDRRFDLKSVVGPVRFSVSHVLEPAGDGTRLHVSAEADPGRLFRFAGPLVTRQAERQLKDDFARLKRLLES